MNTTTTQVRATALQMLTANKPVSNLKINYSRNYFTLLGIEIIRKLTSKFPF